MVAFIPAAAEDAAENIGGRAAAACLHAPGWSLPKRVGRRRATSMWHASNAPQ